MDKDKARSRYGGNRLQSKWNGGSSKIGKQREKKEIMINKSKLKGEKLFIEHDLSWGERKIQEKMNTWAKEQKGKGIEIKIGLGRIRIGGIWRVWAEIEKEEEVKEEKRGVKRKSGEMGKREE